jgi:hypothetical protein
MKTNRFDSNPYQGGAGLADGGLASDLSALVNGLAKSDSGILGGGFVTTATHTQVAGTGATTWTVGITALDTLVDGVYNHDNLNAAFAVHNSTCLVTDGQSVYAWLLEKHGAGTVTTVAVKGTAAVHGAEAVPTDDEIQLALGAGVTFIKLALLHISRTSTTLTEKIDMSYRQPHGVAGMNGF